MDRIRFLYKGKVVGEDNVPNFSTDESRDVIALRLNIEAYDNYLFLDADGKQRFNANETIYYGEPYGSYSGIRYSLRLKEGFIND